MQSDPPFLSSKDRIFNFIILSLYDRLYGLCLHMAGFSALEPSLLQLLYSLCFPHILPQIWQSYYCCIFQLGVHHCHNQCVCVDLVVVVYNKFYLSNCYIQEIMYMYNSVSYKGHMSVCGCSMGLSPISITMVVTRPQNQMFFTLVGSSLVKSPIYIILTFICKPKAFTSYC